MKISRKQLRSMLIREANLILEEVVDNSKLAKDVADLIAPTEGPVNLILKNNIENRLHKYPDLVQELLQFLDTTALTGTAYTVDQIILKINDILSKYME